MPNCRYGPLLGHNPLNANDFREKRPQRKDRLHLRLAVKIRKHVRVIGNLFSCYLLAYRRFASGRRVVMGVRHTDQRLE